MPPTTLYATNTCVVQKIVVQLNDAIFATFLLFSSSKRFFFLRFHSVARISSHKTQATKDFMVLFVILLYGCYNFFFLREINSSSVTVYPMRNRKILYRKKNSSSLWMFYIFFLSVVFTMFTHLKNFPLKIL